MAQINNEKNNSNQLDVWLNRQSALLNMAQTKLREQQALSPTAEAEESFQAKYEQQQLATCRRLLELLTQFTGDAGAFLASAPDRIDNLSKRYLWRELLNESSTDLQIIEAAYDQRLSVNGKRMPETRSLFTADILGEHALGRAVDNKFLPPTPIVSYLRENVIVRPVPYATVVLIGIAYATMLEPAKKNGDEASSPRVSRDLLAIPHEVGHHVFWHGRAPGTDNCIYQELEQRYQQAGIWEWDWRRAWLEEIFADVYGILVAGPLMALSFQDLLTDDPPSEFMEDNGHHPIPALRPYIQTCILRRITADDGSQVYQNAPKRLDEQWGKWAGKHFSDVVPNDDPRQMAYNVRGLAHPLQGERILAALDEPIDIILQTLRAQRPSGAGSDWEHGKWPAWSADLGAEDAGLSVLYENLNLENFPLESDWLSYPEVTAPKRKTTNWPNLILAGWSIEGPEDRGA